MTSRDFTYWLQGFFEISGENELNEEQVKMIKRHLNLVFVHDIDPSMGGPEIQKKLNEIHNDIGEGDSRKCPHPGWKWHSFHKIWYDPEVGAPRC